MNSAFSTNFLNDIKNHKITVIENSDHSKIFKATRSDGSISKSFTVIYADNKAIITGDMGHYVFGRLLDVYGFFLNNESAFSMGYVKEKLLAEDKFNKAERYDSEQAEQTIRSIIKDYRNSLDEDDCQDTLNKLEESLENVDFDSEIEIATWLYSLTGKAAEIFDEYNLDDFTVLDKNFIWCVEGLIWATREFNRLVNATDNTVTPNIITDTQRLDFIERNWCSVDDGINEIRIDTRIIVGQTTLRAAIDQIMQNCGDLYD